VGGSFPPSAVRSFTREAPSASLEGLSAASPPVALPGCVSAQTSISLRYTSPKMSPPRGEGLRGFGRDLTFATEQDAFFTSADMHRDSDAASAYQL
jgi:hypothetical protein